MSSFNKIIYTALFFVSACGFSPVNNGSTSSKLLGQINIQEPNTQNEFIFYSQLVNRFGDIGDKYFLSYEIATSKKDRALNFDGTVHRIEMSGSVLFNLEDRETGTKILSEREDINLSYSNSGSTAAVLNSERTTSKQLIVLLAGKVADQLSLAIVEKSL